MHPFDSLSAPERAFLQLRTERGLVHMPALDGLRGLAVAAVVAFHGNWLWAQGGFLGVSLFLTLSGFLITSLLIEEYDRRDGIWLLGFWGKRSRRLLPAAWLTLAIVVIVTVVLGEFTSALRLDVWSSLGNVANWRFIAAGDSYNDLFAEPSPLRHFWSLAIEEQCYIVLPVVVGVTLRFGRRGLRSLVTVLGVLLAASIAATVLASDPDRIYYGTDTRAAELLLGALLAVAVAHEPFRRRVLTGFWARWGALAAGGVGLAVTVAAWVSVAVADPIVSNGGLVVAGVASAALVLTAAMGTGPVAATLTLAPLRFLGRISYGLYLFHWPLFVFLTERRTGLEHGPRFVLQVSLAVALATISHRWFEQPVRRVATGVPSLRLQRLAPVVVVALVVATVGVGTVAPNPGGFDAEKAADRFRQISRGSAIDPSATAPDATTIPTVPPAPGEPAVVPPPIPSVAVFGDSVALSIAFSLNPWTLRTGKATFLGGDTEMGCGIGRGGVQRAFGETQRTDECDAWSERWATFLADHHPDIALIQSGQWELVDRKLPGDDQWRHLGDPVYDDYLRGEFLAATDQLAASGTIVAWMTLPAFSRLDEERQPQAMRISHDQARVDRLNEIVREVAAERPDTVRIIDLALWMSDKIDDQTLRKDGSHFNESGADAVIEDFLGPKLIQLWRDWLAHHPGNASG